MIHAGHGLQQTLVTPADSARRRISGAMDQKVGVRILRRPRVTAGDLGTLTPPPSRLRPLQPGNEIDIVDIMTKLTTISVTTEQHEQLKEMANSDGIAMWELVDRFLRRERRRRIGQMLIETNVDRTSEERLFEAAVAAAGSRSVRDALR